MKKIKRTLQTIFLAAACYTFTACGSATDVTYLQDLHPNVMIELQKVQEIKLQPGDKLSIVVHSRDNELAQMFNLSSYNTESAKVSSNSSNSYTIDNQGNIDVPNLGLINTIGLTRLDLANKIKQELLTQELLKDPVVTVEFTNLSYSIIGEVNNPGRKEFTRDQLTLLEAGSASMASSTIPDSTSLRYPGVFSSVLKSPVRTTGSPSAISITLFRRTVELTSLASCPRWS